MHKLANVKKNAQHNQNANYSGSYLPVFSGLVRGLWHGGPIPTTPYSLHLDKARVL